jgi:hypothetical protein
VRCSATATSVVPQPTPTDPTWSILWLPTTDQFELPLTLRSGQAKEFWSVSASSQWNVTISSETQ